MSGIRKDKGKKKPLFLHQESGLRFGQFIAAEATTSSLIQRAGTLGVLPRLPDPIFRAAPDARERILSKI